MSLLFTGCTQSNTSPGWSLRVNGELFESDGQYQFDGDVELGGRPTNVTLIGVKVVYLDANHTQLSTDYIGNISGLAVRNISQTLTEKPKYIIVKVDEIHTHPDSDYQIEGAVVIEEQGEYILPNRYTEYDPVC